MVNATICDDCNTILSVENAYQIKNCKGGVRFEKYCKDCKKKRRKRQEKLSSIRQEITPVFSEVKSKKKYFKTYNYPGFLKLELSEEEFFQVVDLVKFIMETEKEIMGETREH